VKPKVYEQTPEEEKKNMCVWKRSPSKRDGQAKPPLDLSKSQKVIDKNELIGNQPLKNTKEIQEEG